jgi:hypothetical protein
MSVSEHVPFTHEGRLRGRLADGTRVNGSPGMGGPVDVGGSTPPAPGPNRRSPWSRPARAAPPTSRP